MIPDNILKQELIRKQRDKMNKLAAEKAAKKKSAVLAMVRKHKSGVKKTVVKGIAKKISGFKAFKRKMIKPLSMKKKSPIKKPFKFKIKSFKMVTKRK